MARQSDSIGLMSELHGLVSKLETHKGAVILRWTQRTAVSWWLCCLMSRMCDETALVIYKLRIDVALDIYMVHGTKINLKRLHVHDAKIFLLVTQGNI